MVLSTWLVLFLRSQKSGVPPQGQGGVTFPSCEKGEGVQCSLGDPGPVVAKSTSATKQYQRNRKRRPK